MSRSMVVILNPLSVVKILQYTDLTYWIIILSDIAGSDKWSTED